MLILQGILRAATTLGGTANKKTGELIPLRHVLQVETIDGRGLVKMDTITVPELGQYTGKVGEKVNVPVRAWAPGAAVSFVFEAPGEAA
jgi:molybdenum cofactor biosynthesis enzyme